MSRTRLARFAPLVLLFAPIAFAQDKPSLPGDGTLLQVSAHGESQRAPDLAQISAGVVTQDANANAAMRANAQRMSAVVAALRQAGVAERDVQTSSISLEAQYSYNTSGNGSKPPAIVSYQASNTVNVRLRDIGKVGDVLDALVKQGANQINGPTFSVDKPDAAMDEARTAAIRQAQSRADLYATATGLKVRRIVSISESGEMAQPPRPMMMGLMKAAAAAPTPVETGENTLGVDLNVVFELAR